MYYLLFYFMIKESIILVIKEVHVWKVVMSMKKVINQLSEIEKAADNIVTEAVKKKDEIFNEAELKKQELDEKMNAELEDRIKNLNINAHTKMEQDMEHLKSSTQESIRTIQEIYDNHHSELAQEIMNRIVGA